MATPGIPSWALVLADADGTCGTDWFYHAYGYKHYNACWNLGTVDMER
jgi:hypothetical protein